MWTTSRRPQAADATANLLRPLSYSLYYIRQQLELSLDDTLTSGRTGRCFGTGSVVVDMEADEYHGNVRP